MPYTTIYYWPDGVWCYKSELSEYLYKSDDYTAHNVPDNMTCEQIDALVDILVYFGE